VITDQRVFYLEPFKRYCSWKQLHHSYVVFRPKLGDIPLEQDHWCWAKALS